MGDTQGTCLVIGAAGGIGTALLPLLDEAGWGLALAGRSKAGLDDAASAFAGSEVYELEGTDFDAVATVCKEIDGLRAIVNLPGSIVLKPAHGTSADEFEHTINQNLRTAFAVTRAAGMAMRNTGGSVVLMSTCAATCGLPNHEAISAAKAGVEGLTRSAAATYASAGIRFNAIAPGLVDTPLAESITKNEAALKASTAMHPLGRIGRPQDIASAISFALSPAQSWMTGQVIGVDGGLARLKGR